MLFKGKAKKRAVRKCSSRVVWNRAKQFHFVQLMLKLVALSRQRRVVFERSCAKPVAQIGDARCGERGVLSASGVEYQSLRGRYEVSFERFKTRT